MYRCDFCGLPQVSCEYPVRDYSVRYELGRLAFALHYIDNAWAACRYCRRLIEQNYRPGLARRMLEPHGCGGSDSVPAQTGAIFTRDVDEFFAHRLHGQNHRWN